MEELKTGEFELGVMLGSRRAFAAVSGRCSAADAECLRRLRDQKLYLSRAASWEEFCPQFLGLSKTHANRLIRHLEEFGPDFFEVAQLTRITPEQYRAIAPAIREKSIHVNGQAIALLPENSDRVAAAVAELRQAATPVPNTQERMAAVQRCFDRFVKDYKELANSGIPLAEKAAVWQLLADNIMALHRLQLQRRC